MRRNEAAVCGTCPYWKWRVRVKRPGEAASGECRESTPHVGERDYFVFPKTFEDHWCGRHPDFELKEEEPKAPIGAMLIDEIEGIVMDAGGGELIPRDWDPFQATQWLRSAILREIRRRHGQ